MWLIIYYIYKYYKFVESYQNFMYFQKEILKKCNEKESDFSCMLKPGGYYMDVCLLNRD